MDLTLINSALQPKLSVAEQLGDQRDAWITELKTLFQSRPDQFDPARAKLLSEALLKDFFDDTEQYRQNTWKTFYTNWKPYYLWCAQNEILALPSSHDAITQYLDNACAHYSANSLKLHVWAISMMHEAAGLPDPTVSRKIKNKLKRLSETALLNRQYVKQASPFRHRHLQQVKALWRNSGSLSQRRDLALLAVAHSSLLRESELANIRFEDIEIVEDLHDDARSVAIVTIPITKTNHSGLPDTVALRGETFDLVNEYLQLAGLSWFDHGWLFRPVIARSNKLKPMMSRSGNPLARLSGLAIDRIFAKAHTELCIAGVRDPSLPAWTGHSARVGAAQDRRIQGDAHLEIAHAGRWKSMSMVLQYTRAVDAQER